MSHTVTAALARARRRYPDLDKGGSLTLELLQEAHDEILELVPLCTDEEDVALTDADPLYDEDEDILKVWEVTLRRSSADNDVKRLCVKTQAQMDRDHPNWKYAAARSEPECVVMESVPGTGSNPAKMQWRFWPTLDITVASGYPKVTATVTRKQTLGTASNTTSLPQLAKHMDAWLEGIWKRFAVLYLGEKEREMHDRRFDKRVQELLTTVQTHSVEVQPEMTPFWVQAGRAL